MKETGALINLLEELSELREETGVEDGPGEVSGGGIRKAAPGT